MNNYDTNTNSVMNNNNDDCLLISTGITEFSCINVWNCWPVIYVCT